MQELSESEFDEKVVQSDLPVLVDFGATWCPPCRMLDPIVEQIASEYAGKLTVYEVNTDSNPGLAQRFGITGIPTLIFYKQGEHVNTIVGFRDYDTLKSIVESIL
ncbi:MAG: thioredoxin [Planctomycetales bacterium 4484_113]|mgnify:CR=1 FL=1|nr:MAG: thioredoxin [Planctomycetales bacterium 4484_113]